MSLDFEGKPSDTHHLRMALSVTPNCCPIFVKGIVRIRLLSSSREGLSHIRLAEVKQSWQYLLGLFIGLPHLLHKC